jgi:hypothetical protein
LRIEYDKFRPMDWTSRDKAQQPVEQFLLRFNPQTQQGRFIPVLRPQWRLDQVAP